MLGILIALTLGIIVGLIFKFNEKQKFILSKLQLVGVTFLLFSMGASIGIKDSILLNLKNIGLSSLFFALSTSLFSIIIVYFITKLFFKGDL
jgi:uncharacterized membrane protein YbjE (DUF340 family)